MTTEKSNRNDGHRHRGSGACGVMTSEKPKETLGLYVHIPFCEQKCRYCDFLSFGGQGQKEQELYCCALEREIWMRGQSLSQAAGLAVDTVFLGGGTPSLLAPALTERIMRALSDCFPISPQAEITTEANPKTLSPEKLTRYRQAGINRLSMGVQTLNPSLLKVLGRIHTTQDFFENFHQARACGFDNINVDLIFSLPGQTLAIWNETLDGILELSPEHISFYSLQIEEGTPFYQMFLSGEIQQTPDELDRAMYHSALCRLEQAGYQRYEISNGARREKPGEASPYRCRHNLKYWSMENYLGLGLGAHSYLNPELAAHLPRNPELGNSFSREQPNPDWQCGASDGREEPKQWGRRFFNQDTMKEYLKAAEEPFSEVDLFLKEAHRNTAEEERSDFFFTQLRKTEGFSLEDYRRRFGEELESRYRSTVERFTAEALLDRKGGRIFLTQRGTDLANQVIREFI